MSGLELRPAGPDDTGALCELFRRNFPHNPKAAPDVLRWQYWDNPFGRAASWVMVDGDQVVCHFAVLPLPGRLAGRPATVGNTADAATDPAYRRSGLMGRTARAALDECARRGIQVAVSFPNVNSRGALRQIGMREVANVRAYVLPLDEQWLGDRFPLPTVLAGPAARLVFHRRRTSGGAAGCRDTQRARRLVAGDWPAGPPRCRP